MQKFSSFLLLFPLLIGWIAACTPSPSFDILIQHGMIYDGTGAAPVQGDIGIVGDQIVQIGDLSDAQTDTTIDASGLAVAPGFIDLHAHLNAILELPACESHIRQGVTTSLGGPDGGGPWPLGNYLDTLSQMGIGMNVAYLIGHNTIRRNVMGLDNRAPTLEELEGMQAMVALAMEEGAFGISTGLKYIPGAYSKVDEVIALSQVAARYGGFYTSHLREEGLGLLEGVQEAIVIGREASIPIVLTHHKAVGKPMWGASVKTLAMVDSARAAGQDVMIDQYPYTASHTGIRVMIPAWAMAGGQEAFLTRLKDPVLNDSIRQGILFNLLNDRGGGDLKRIQFAKVDWQPELEGKTLYEWCTSLEMEPTLENGVELVLRAQQNGGANCIYHVMQEEDVERIMRHPQTMIASDGSLTKLGEGSPHPRSYGTFPRVIGHYAREKKILTLKEAIHKMTGMPAQRMGLSNRGKIAENMMADLVIFNPETILDKGTFTDPHQYPEGIEYVLVNGVFAVERGEFTGKKAGKVLYGPGKK